MPEIFRGAGRHAILRHMNRSSAQIDCCIVGAGPAGMMLGYLLARAGASVAILEKHANFLRDFRGDTIHPSTLEIMHELGLLDRLLALPHEKAFGLAAQVGDTIVRIADFGHLPVRCRYIAFMPQWDFLNFLAEAGRNYRGFHLYMQTEATDLLRTGDAISGVRATTADGDMDIHCRLVIGADGRHSILREKADLKTKMLGAPMDVLWFDMPRLPEDPRQTMGRFDVGRIFIMINRGDRWQCGFVIAKGSADRVRGLGIEAFQEAVASLAPFVGDRVKTLAGWDQIKLLAVGVDRLEKWYRPGLLFIGDAAHTMSPIGGVGINLAIQDAVAAANTLALPLLAGSLSVEQLRKVQQRRLLPARITQKLQVIAQNHIVRSVLDSTGALEAPRLFRLFAYLPFLARLPARLIGLGVRREHIDPSLRLPAPMDEHSGPV